MVHEIPAFCVAGAALAASGTYAWGSVAPPSQLFGPTIRRTGDASTIALTFDDGPNPAITPQLLDLLDRHRVKATFFLIGAWVREAPSLASDIAARGHAAGNHTDTHPSLALRSKQRITDELNAVRRCHRIGHGA